MVRMIVPLTPANVLTADERNFVRELGTDENWVFEYVLAMYGVIQDIRSTGRDDYLYNQLAGDLGDSIIGMDDLPESYDCQTGFALKFDRLHGLILKVADQLVPYVDSVSRGLPSQPVEVITFEPLIVPNPRRPRPSPVAEIPYRSTVLTFHLEDPKPNWLTKKGMW